MKRLQKTISCIIGDPSNSLSFHSYSDFSKQNNILICHTVACSSVEVVIITDLEQRQKSA